MNNFEIILIEDDDNDAELAIRTLKRAELAKSVIRLKDGEEAIAFFSGEKASDNTPRLVLLDLKMPKVDGLEVLRKIRSVEQTKKIPVVMLTSSKEQKDIMESYDLGANSYVVKPVDFKEFTATIISIGKYWVELNEMSNK